MEEKCVCCKIARGDGCGFQKIIVNMEGGWVLNHFSASNETYLGRLVLGTKQHRHDFGNLSCFSYLSRSNHSCTLRSTSLMYCSSDNPITGLRHASILSPSIFACSIFSAG